MSLVILPLDVVKPLGNLIAKVREESTMNAMLDGMSQDLGNIILAGGGTQEQADAVRPHLELSLTDTLVEIVMDKLVYSVGHVGHTETLRTIVDGKFGCGFPGRVSHLESLLGVELFEYVRASINFYDYYGMLSIWLERVSSSDVYSVIFRETMIIVTNNLVSFTEYNFRNVVSVSIINKTLSLFFNVDTGDEV